MIRKLLPLLFTMYITCSYAQVTYHKCTVYSTKPGHGTDSFISKTLLFNKHGKVTEERIYRKPTAEDGKDNTARLSQLILYTYTKDTLLSLKKTICLRGTEHCLDDTVVASYSYDENNKLTTIISAAYGRGGTGCLVGIAGTRWYDSTKTAYKYDEKGNLIQEATSDMAYNMPTGLTTGFSPNFAAYHYDDKNRINAINHLYITSLTYFGAELVKEDNIVDTIELAKEIYHYHHKCRTIELVTQKSESIPPDISFTFYDQPGNIIQEYIHNSYSTGNYGSPVERFYAYLPDKRLVKEICYNDLGQIERVDSYIYE